MSIHVDICFATASDHEFTLTSTGFHSKCVGTVSQSVVKVLLFSVGAAIRFAKRQSSTNGNGSVMVVEFFTHDVI